MKCPPFQLLTAQPPGKKYGVILADPPWQYSAKSVNGSAEKEYSTMSIDDICALKVSSVAADNCVLVLWTTWPMLCDSFKVIESWGFKHLTGLPWIKLKKSETDLWGEWHHKTQFGVGYWVRGVSEPVLICRRGKPKLPNKTFIGLLSPNLGHSRKPDSIYEFCESLNGPYLEMFCRRTRPGWDQFGNEVKGSIRL